jgi:hypothetical protein
MKWKQLKLSIDDPHYIFIGKIYYTLIKQTHLYLNKQSLDTHKFVDSISNLNLLTVY